MTGCKDTTANLLIAIAFLLVLVVAAFGCSEYLKTDATSDTKGVDGDGESNEDDEKNVEVTVRVKSIEMESVAPQTEASGTVTSERDITVVSQTAGRVVSDYLTLGKAVSKGDALVVVDSEPYRIARDAAIAQLSQAQTALDQSETEFNRAKLLHQSRDISDQMFDSARFALERAKGAMAAAQAAVDSANRNLREATIRAPFGGEIAAKLVKQGDTIAAGTPIAQLVDRSSLKVSLGVSEQVIGSMRIGLPAEVSIPTLSNTPFPAAISAIGPKALQPTMTYPVEVVFANPPDSVRVGMVARVTLQAGDKHEGLLVPVEVMHEKYDHYFVWRVVDGLAKETEIKIGERIGRRVVVTDGLEPGAVIVVSGESKLKNDDRVKIVE